jgi:hypothetical protein
MSALNEDELSQFIMVMQNMMKTFEDMHYNYKKQIMDPSIWKGWENLGRITRALAWTPTSRCSSATRKVLGSAAQTKILTDF